MQRHYLQGEPVETVYFGGGTPSLLEKKHLNKILDSLSTYYDLSAVTEFTLEANPDDITSEKLLLWKRAGINRLSIGVQSFFEEDLRWMNRLHHAADILKTLQMTRQAGFENINIDLIYGLPEMTMDRWQRNLEIFFSCQIPHLSAYCLTVEPQTALEAMIRKGKKKTTNEDIAIMHFEMLMNMMQHHQYEHYEISNFALSGKYSLHNTSYWFGKKYLGLGPSAHSFNGIERQYNASNNIKYIRFLLHEKKLPAHVEKLTIENRFNEMLLTRLRTIWGLDLNMLSLHFPYYMIEKIKKEAEPYMQTGAIVLENNTMKLSRSGKMIADKIISDLMIVNQ
jgi:oxygen-independent coproporphyrinogen-3 oxidase